MNEDEIRLHAERIERIATQVLAATVQVDPYDGPEGRVWDAIFLAKALAEAIDKEFPR